MKKNQPPPLPQPTLTFKQVYHTIVNPTIDSFTLANEAIDKIVERGTKILYNTYLWTKMPQHLSNFVVTAYSELAQQEVMPYDPGESIDHLICNWNDDEEPEGTPLDSWSVYTAKVTRARAPTPTTMNNDSFTSVNDHHRNSIFGKARSSLRKLTALSSARKSPAKQLDHVSEQVDLLKQEYELKFEKEPPVVIEEDKVVDQIREDIALRKKIKQKKLEEEEEIKRKKEELNQKIKAFERQSKDNAYTFDYEGNVMYVTKQENPKKKAVSNYNLQNPLATLKRLPTDAPVREIEEREDDLKALSLLSTKQLTQEKYGMSKTAQFRDIIKMKPGAMLKMPNGVRQGPDFKEPERMRRDDFMKILESRKTDRGKQRDLKKIEEEEDSEDQKRKAESALASQLRKLAELNHMSEIEIHQHDILAQMIMNNTDPRHVEEMWNNRAKSKIEKEAEAEPVRRSVLEDRIVEYNRTGFSEIKKQEPRPTTTKAQLKVHVSKIQQGLDNYNRNLLQKETWGQEKPRLSQITLTPIATPRLSPEKKLTLKASLFESHALKEPRERTTVGQKRALAQTARGAIESDKVVLPLIDIRSARAGDVEDKKFLLRSSSGKEKLPDNFEMKLKKQDLKQSGAKGNDDPYLIKNKSSLSVAVSLSKSSHTPRPRVNV